MYQGMNEQVRIGLFDSEKMFTYLRGYSEGLNMTETQKALNFARKYHKEQKRKDGTPYIIHPLTMACHAVSLGLKDDELIATILCHDLVEDCDVSLDSLPCNESIRESVRLMTYIKPERSEGMTNEEYGQVVKKYKEYYYNQISQNKNASLCKLFDRCHNVSTMAGVFTQEKLLAYLHETYTYIYPLFRSTKEYYPETSSVVFNLKYHIISVTEGIWHTYNIVKGDSSKDD